ncbi:hypothetical protein L2D08_18235 [Domibacillus sp. PGB-M46]|uniref:hypothetical protein n=1 Tax=Domibacillus sp. PGB-M46 TaxID=2910255 RepID=UPI001F59F0CC|nr:hypothetical protein [Domibacillus sp. PGB-M46]MCI2256286.1 hypothetical protein [Domibacillus sp. PGB-M46]
MKVIGVFLFVTTMASVFCIILDILMGFTFSEARMHLLDPLFMMDVSEYLVILLFLFITIGHQIIMRKNQQK